jgi:hypothetical protein
METLKTPKSKPEMEQWYGTIDTGGPALPTRIAEIEEFGGQPLFVHPAEKPQSAADQVSRFKIYDNY